MTVVGGLKITHEDKKSARKFKKGDLVVVAKDIHSGNSVKIYSCFTYKYAPDLLQYRVKSTLGRMSKNSFQVFSEKELLTQEEAKALRKKAKSRVVTNYRTIKFNNREIRLEGKKAAFENLQPTVLHNLSCRKCQNRFKFACNECVIPKKSTIPSLFVKIGRETMRGPNDTIIRVNAQWEKMYTQPMADYDPICKVCANRFTISCNKCLWRGDCGNDAKHSMFESCNTPEEKAIIIEEIKADVQLPFEMIENFSFFKMIKNGETIFMGMAHKDNIEMLGEMFKIHNEAKEDEVDDDMLHIHKDNANIVVTKKLAYVNLKNLDEEEKSGLVDKLFHMVGEALSPPKNKTKEDNEPPTKFPAEDLEFIKFENSEICITCGKANTNDDVNLCDVCLTWYEQWYPAGHPRD